MKSTILVCAVMASFIGTAMADDLKLVASSNGHGGTNFLYRRDTPTLTVCPFRRDRPTRQVMQYNTHGQPVGFRTVAE